MKGAVSVTFHLELELKESYVDEIAFYVQVKMWELGTTGHINGYKAVKPSGTVYTA